MKRLAEPRKSQPELLTFLNARSSDVLGPGDGELRPESSSEVRVVLFRDSHHLMNALAGSHAYAKKAEILRTKQLGSHQGTVRRNLVDSARLSGL